MKKSLIITGAAGNLGKTVTQRMLDNGYFVEATLGPNDSLDFIEHNALTAEKVDLVNEQKATEYVRKVVENCDELTAAILLVGGFAPGGFKQTDEAALDKMYALNFKTTYFVVRPLLEVFEQQPQGGKIILIGTRPAFKANEGKNLVAYSLSKSMVMHMAELINDYGNQKGISCTVIVPSTLDTPATRSSMPDADFSKWVPTDKVADTIDFILSDAGSMLRETVIKIYNKS